MKTFGETLSSYLSANGISKKELARRSGISSPYITQLANGKILDPTFDKACMSLTGLFKRCKEFCGAVSCINAAPI